jgi:hypothetical protein
VIVDCGLSVSDWIGLSTRACTTRRRDNGGVCQGGPSQIRDLFVWLVFRRHQVGREAEAAPSLSVMADTLTGEIFGQRVCRRGGCLCVYAWDGSVKARATRGDPDWSITANCGRWRGGDCRCLRACGGRNRVHMGKSSLSSLRQKKHARFACTCGNDSPRPRRRK